MEQEMSPDVIGKSVNRLDAMDKVTGKAMYPGDFSTGNQLHAKILFAAQPHAIIKRIDLSKALSLDGVITILTAPDVPNNEYGLITPDQPVLCGPGSNKEFADRVRCISDQVAVVVAKDEIIAKQAIELICVEYVPLDVITDIEVAAQPDTVLIHPDKKSNIVSPFRIRNGDISEGESMSDVVISDTYHTPAQEHAYLQPEAGFAYEDQEGRITIVVAGQWAHEDREQVAHALMVPEEEIRIIYPAIGGAFGGREDMSIQIVLGLAVKKLRELGINQPIKIVWSRKESIVGHHKRHPYKIELKVGAKRDGKLTFLKADITADCGAYMYTSNKVLANATLMIAGPYNIPNVWIDSRAVYTNNLPNGAFRGFGAPQGCFAIEMHMNKLAEQLGIDPIGLRLINTIKEGQKTSVKSALPKGITIDKVINECAVKSDWDHKWNKDKNLSDVNSHLLYGHGFAAGFKNVGFSYGAPENCWAEVEFFGDGEIDKLVLHHAGADVGQGAHTVFSQMAADFASIDIDKVELITSDTATSGSSGSASASRLTFMSGNAIKGAVEQALRKWKKGERPAKATHVYWAPKTSPLDPTDGSCLPNFSYGYVAEQVDVEVNIRTGKVRIINVFCADDVGKAINPQQVKGQIEGAIVQAAGYTLLEKFVQKDGYVKTDSLATYLIPTIMDIPQSTTSIIVEGLDPIGPAGARGMAEMPYIPLAPAIVSAVHDATGVWFNRFPLDEETVLKGLGVIE
jgi:CO/xanthine dehydrogenase Mo-binding subunit